MRFVAGAVLSLFAVCFCSAQDYIEQWRRLTPGTENRSLSWTGAAADSSNNVIAVGVETPASGQGDRKLVATKLSSGGDDIWTAQMEEGQSIGAGVLQVDGAGNAYFLVGDFTARTLTVRSLSGADGSFRWERTFQNVSTNQQGGRNGADLKVRTIGNSTFLYFALSEDNGTVRLTRLNPANGQVLFTSIVNGSLTSRARQNLDLDANGNVYMMFNNIDAIITKRSQSLGLVWNRVLAKPFDAGFAVHPVTGEIGASTEQTATSGSSDFQVLDPVNGTVRRHASGIPTASNVIRARANDVFGHPGGGWIIGPLDAFDMQSAILLSPTLKRTITTAPAMRQGFVDSSGMLHGDKFNTGLDLVNWPRLNVLDLGFGGAGSANAIAIDSQDRLIMAGGVSGSGILIQLEQKFLAGTDIFAQEFIGELNVEAPGVMVNDPLSRGSTLAVTIAPTLGSVTLNQDGSFRYVPGPNFAGSDQFQYRLTKGGVSRTATCFIKRLTAAMSLSDNNIFGGEQGSELNVVLSSGAFAVPFELTVFSNNQAPLVGTFPRNLFFRPGTVSQTTGVSTRAVASPTTVTFSVTLSGTTRTVTLTLLPGKFKDIVPVDGRPVFEGLATKYRISLENPASRDRTFALTYRQSFQGAPVVLTGPAQVTIQAGALSADFTATAPDSTAGAGTLVLARELDSSLNFLNQFTIAARPQLSGSGPLVSPIYSGFQNRFEVQIDKPAGNVAIQVTNSSNVSGVSVPTISVPVNQTSGSASFTPPLSVANQNVTITSRLLTDSRTSTFLVRPNLLEAFNVSPGVMSRLGNITARVEFNWVATGNGVPIQISSTTPSLVVIPSQVTMAPGRTVLTFPIGARGQAGNAKVTVKVGLKAITKSITITN